MIVRSARNSDLHDLALIHYRSLPEDFLPSLGKDFLEKVYYPVAINAKYAKTFTGESKGTICGFITVASNSAKFSREVLYNHLFEIIIYALRAIFLSPSILIKSVQVLWSVLFLEPDEIDSEIVFIAVDKEFRHKGVGTELVESAIEYLRKNLIKQCRTKTLSENTNAIKMYQKMDWRIRNKLRMIDRDYVIIVSPLEE